MSLPNPEVLSLYDPRTNTTQVGEILGRKSILRPIDEFGEDVENILALVSGERVSLFCKRPEGVVTPPSTPTLGDGTGKNAGELYEIWRRLNIAGLPVAPQAWIANRESVACPDLTVGGEHFYDRRDSKLIGKRGRPLLPTDPVFLSISRENIEDALWEVIEIASRQDIVIPFDDPMALLVKPNGNFKVYLLDFTTTMFDHSLPRRANISYASRFMRYMDNTRKLLEKHLSKKTIDFFFKFI